MGVNFSMINYKPNNRKINHRFAVASYNESIADMIMRSFRSIRLHRSQWLFTLMLWHKIWIYLLNENGNWVIHILPLSTGVACLTSASRYIQLQGEIAFWLHVFDVSFNHGLEWYLKNWGPLASLNSVYVEDTYSSLVARSFCCKHFIQCLDVDLQTEMFVHILISNLVDVYGFLCI